MLQKSGSAFLALGGGAIIQEPIQRLCDRYQALTFFLDVSFPTIWKRVGNLGGRPLLGSETESEGERFTKAAALYEARLPVYRQTADVTIGGNREKNAVCERILEILGLTDSAARTSDWTGRAGT